MLALSAWHLGWCPQIPVYTSQLVSRNAFLVSREAGLEDLGTWNCHLVPWWCVTPGMGEPGRLLVSPSCGIRSGLCGP